MNLPDSTSAADLVQGASEKAKSVHKQMRGLSDMEICQVMALAMDARDTGAPGAACPLRKALITLSLGSGNLYFTERGEVIINPKPSGGKRQKIKRRRYSQRDRMLRRKRKKRFYL